MQVILKRDVTNLGQAGDLVEVKSGYGANYLIPQGLAARATSRNKAEMEHKRRQIEAELARHRKHAATLREQLDGISVTLTRLVGEDDKIFGSVTTNDIAKALADEGIEVERRQIQLDEALKSLGVYEVPVSLHRDVEAIIKVWVVAD